MKSRNPKIEQVVDGVVQWAKFPGTTILAITNPQQHYTANSPDSPDLSDAPSKLLRLQAPVESDPELALPRRLFALLSESTDDLLAQYGLCLLPPSTAHVTALDLLHPGVMPRLAAGALPHADAYLRGLPETLSEGPPVPGLPNSFPAFNPFDLRFDRFRISAGGVLTARLTPTRETTAQFAYFCRLRSEVSLKWQRALGLPLAGTWRAHITLGYLLDPESAPAVRENLLPELVGALGSAEETLTLREAAIHYFPSMDQYYGQRDEAVGAIAPAWESVASGGRKANSAWAASSHSFSERYDEAGLKHLRGGQALLTPAAGQAVVERASELPTFHLAARQFFPAASGVLTLVFTGFPESVLRFQKLIDELLPELRPDAPGVKLPKCSLGALNPGFVLGLEEARTLRALSREFGPELHEELADIVIDQLSLVIFRCRSLEERWLTHPISLGPADANDGPTLEQLEHEGEVAAPFDDSLESYMPMLCRPGYRSDHYSRPFDGAALVCELGHLPRPASVERFIEAVEGELPGWYTWWNHESLHVRIRGLDPLL